MSLKNYRVALVVDNPYRDLTGLVLVATELCKMGATCYLVPFNLLTKEISYLLPDFVLLNYQRENIYEATNNKFHSWGIKLGVLDTESISNPIPKHANTLLQNDEYKGEFPEFDDYFVIMTKDAQARASIDCYCCWNESFANYLIQSKWYIPSNVYVTGSPRADLFSAKWKATSIAINPQLNEIKTPMVLINSNFTLAGPKFQTDEEEVEMMVKSYNFDREYMLQWLQIEKQARKEFVDLANTLSNKFPDINFVFRPHPFEDETFYNANLHKNSNLHFIKKGTLDAWLHKSSALIHNKSCTTSIEAGLAGVPVLTAAWIKVGRSSPILDGISIEVSSMESMIAHINLIKENKLVVSQPIKERISKIQTELYYKVDGASSERVAQAIINSIQKSSKTILLKKAKKEIYAESISRKDKWTDLIIQIRERMNLSVHFSFSKLKNIYRKQLPWDNSQKSFSSTQVENCISAIKNHLNPDLNLKVKLADSKEDYHLGYKEGRSVVIKN